jgi:predicted nuclease of predicted toxin-antitoxin system
MPGADDETVIDFARSERRLLNTEDKDFGQLVFAVAKQNSGVTPLPRIDSLRTDRSRAQTPL